MAFLVLAVGGLAVLGRLVQLQVVEHSRWARAAQAVQEDLIELPSRRGTIYDRNGTALAYDVPAWAIALDNSLITKPELLVDLAVRELGLPRSEVLTKVYREGYFTWLDRKVDYEAGRRLRDRARELGVRGLLFFPTWKRAYPQGPLALPVLGVVGVDGEGLAGLELVFDSQLRGKPQRIRVLRNARGQVQDLWVESQGVPGKDLRLTLDSRIQWACEEEIEDGLSKYAGAERGFALMMDPRTGEVLALAHGPRPDPEKPDPALLNPWAITQVFEPGSTFKALTGMIAFELGVAGEEELFSGDSPFVVRGVPIKNARGQSYGTVDFKRGMAQSINTVFVQVALRVGKDRMVEHLRRLGFGACTGIELPGEVEGIVRPDDKWTELDLAVSSFGQGIAVTGIQLGTAFCAMANGGNLVRPRLLPGPTEVRGRAASPQACERIRAVLGYIVGLQASTGWLAHVPGYKVGGKSGTAEMAVPGRGYVPDHVTTGMAAFFPWDKPEYVLIVVYQTTNNPEFWSGQNAVPSAGNIVRRLAALGVIRPYDKTALGRSG